MFHVDFYVAQALKEQRDTVWSAQCASKSTLLCNRRGSSLGLCEKDLEHYFLGGSINSTALTVNLMALKLENNCSSALALPGIAGPHRTKRFAVPQQPRSWWTREVAHIKHNPTILSEAGNPPLFNIRLKSYTMSLTATDNYRSNRIDTKSVRRAYKRQKGSGKRGSAGEPASTRFWIYKFIRICSFRLNA